MTAIASTSLEQDYRRLQKDYEQLSRKYEQSQQEFEQMLRCTSQLSATLELITNLNQSASPKDVLNQAAHASLTLFEADGVALLLHHHEGAFPIMIEGHRSQEIAQHVMRNFKSLLQEERAQLLQLPRSLGKKARHILTCPFGTSWDVIHLENQPHPHQLQKGDAKDIFRVRSKALLVLWKFETPYGLWQASLLEALSKGLHGLLQRLEHLEKEQQERTALEDLLQQVRTETRTIVKESQNISKEAKKIRRHVRHIRSD